MHTQKRRTLDIGENQSISLGEKNYLSRCDDTRTALMLLYTEQWDWQETNLDEVRQIIGNMVKDKVIGFDKKMNFLVCLCIYLDSIKIGVPWKVLKRLVRLNLGFFRSCYSVDTSTLGRIKTEKQWILLEEHWSNPGKWWPWFTPCDSSSDN